MADLKIPNLDINPNKFIFKNKLTLRRKSKRKLIKESFIMLSFGILIIYFIFLIPNKISIFDNFFNNFLNVLSNILSSVTYLYEICLALIIILSLIFAFFLILGSFSRMLKTIKRKTKRIHFK